MSYLLESILHTFFIRKHRLGFILYSLCSLFSFIPHHRGWVGWVSSPGHLPDD